MNLLPKYYCDTIMRGHTVTLQIHRVWFGRDKVTYEICGWRMRDDGECLYMFGKSNNGFVANFLTMQEIQSLLLFHSQLQIPSEWLFSDIELLRKFAIYYCKDKQ